MKQESELPQAQQEEIDDAHDAIMALFDRADMSSIGYAFTQFLHGLIENQEETARSTYDEDSEDYKDAMRVKRIYERAAVHFEKGVDELMKL